MTEIRTEPTPTELCGCSRRQLLVRTGAGALGVAAVGVLAACGSTGSGTQSAPGPATDGAIVKVADIPVGGALAATDAAGKPILLVQATSGTVTALSAVCTHQGCTVNAGKGTLTCPCHGSQYGLDGSVKGGPAPSPLTAVDVHVTNGSVFLGKG